jgi:putative transposase
LFNVIDEGNREVLRMECGNSTPARRLVRVMDDLNDFYGKPWVIRMVNGQEMTIDLFVGHKSVRLSFASTGQDEPECVC